mgnify:CR=1 FL=1
MHHRTTATVTALVLCACLLLTGCSARARQRNLIRNDPMASATWDGIEFLGSKESEDDGPKPSPVAMTRCFNMTIPLEDAHERIFATAKQNGWGEDPPAGPKATRTAFKGTNEGGMSLFVSTTIIRCEQHPQTNLALTITFG